MDLDTAKTPRTRYPFHCMILPPARIKDRTHKITPRIKIAKDVNFT